MGFLADTRILIAGVLRHRSIAYGIAKAAHREGAQLAFTYQSERFRARVADLAGEFGSRLLFPCDVSSDQEIDKVFSDLGESWDGLDGLVHAIAFAPREAIAGDFLEGFSREGFRIAHDISAYSFPAMAKAALPLMQGRKSALLTMSYLGSIRAVPHYNTMGLAKASLEASVRYLATNLGPKGIRVNALSSGPIKTLAAAGVAQFGRLLKHVEDNAPLRRNVTIDEVGNVAAFLVSDLASAITGEVIYADSGYRHCIAGTREENTGSE
ncbi:MAG: enoyl-ACP reductase FabI [Betaproteobacteria bacterium]|nr:enoyl-ACP reductase FabI [Betaproteobacteria bacterium]